MKLKTLVINNIASIEDATIDFANGVLASQDLFLICGPTGSGKTTILDAICLALFNTTPRIEGSTSDAIDDTIAGDAKKKVKDVTNLVRKNAVNASVRLTFEVDGSDYTAEWRVTRTGQYRNNKETSTFAGLPLADKLRCNIIQEWTLTDSSGEIYKKVSEVREKIGEVIKMDFNQFCKTTMLAQGDFTRFLSSKGDEKAQILEKLVGTEQYAEVGNIINLTANAKKSEMEVMAKALENFRFLSEEEKAEKNSQIGALQEEVKAMGEKRKAIADKLQWLADSEKAAGEEADRRKAWEEALNVAQSEEVRQQRQTIDLWDKTTEVRGALTTRQKCETTSAANNAQKQDLSETYTTAISGMTFLANRQTALSNENGNRQIVLDAQQQFEKMFNQIAAIESAHNNLIINQKIVAESVPEIKKLDGGLAKLAPEISRFEKQKKDAEAEIQSIENGNSKRNGRLNELKADLIDGEISALNHRKVLLSEAQSALQACKEAHEDFESKQHTTVAAKGTQAQRATTEQEKKQQLADANAQLAEKQELYEKTKESVSDHAKVLRAKLQQGDTCPVCGNIVGSVLSDDSFIAALKPLEEDFLAARKRAEALTKAHSEALAGLNASNTAVQQAEREEATAKSRRDGHIQTIKEKCAALGITYGKEVGMLLTSLQQEIGDAENAISTRQAEIRRIRGEVSQANTAIKGIRDERITPAERSLKDLNKKAEALNKEKSQLEGKIDTAKAAIARAQNTLNQHLDPDWKPSDSNRYFEELKTAANDYAQMKRDFDSANTEIQTIRKDLDFVATCKAKIDSMFPEWATERASVPQEIQNLSQMWLNLGNDANLLSSSILQNQSAQENADSVISGFTADHPEIALADVTQLLQLSPQQLAALRQHISDITTALSNAKTLHEAAVKQLESLPACPLTEGETAETLQVRADELAVQEQEKSQAIGQLSSELATDEKNRELQGKQKEELDRLRTEYADWETLNSYLGSTGGKKFRNIAQSFILSDLLDKANAYLANISTRYKLFCNPGTLTIMIRDSYQGDVVRTTNTLSGGESFIISLSLALGLSSMQNVDFEVDTLFIDEGFGTLSPEFLDPVIVALKRLHSVYGRRVGIISHVDTLKSHIPATIEVIKEGNTSSKIELRVES